MNGSVVCFLSNHRTNINLTNMILSLYISYICMSEIDRVCTSLNNNFVSIRLADILTCFVDKTTKSLMIKVCKEVVKTIETSQMKHIDRLTIAFRKTDFSLKESAQSKPEGVRFIQKSKRQLQSINRARRMRDGLCSDATLTIKILIIANRE